MRTVQLAARIVRGALSGVLATVPMTAVVWSTARADLRRDIPPTRITRVLARRAQRRGLPRVPLRPATVAMHLGYGAAMGALFGALAAGARRRGVPRTRVLAGVAFGVAVYVAGYAGWIPAARILPPPRRDDPRRQRSLLAAHVVYGSVLGALG